MDSEEESISSYGISDNDMIPSAKRRSNVYFLLPCLLLSAGLFAYYYQGNGQTGASPRAVAETFGVPDNGNAAKTLTAPGRSRPQRNNQTQSKKDLITKFLKLSDGRVDPQLHKIYQNNPRVSGNPSWRWMVERRLNDDYRFCVKVAPFLGPYNYTHKSKNPCWYEEDDAQLRCVPYFYVAGVSKSGTSDVYERIITHPQVFYDGRNKEKHYFDYSRYYDGGKDSIYYYSDMYRKFSVRAQEEIKNEGSSKTVTGDGTPCYFFYSLYWPCYQGNQGLASPRYTNADVIHRLYPGAKIILSLRDPVTRLYSRFLTMKQNESSVLLYQQKVRRAVDLYQACFRQWSYRHCAYNGTLYALAKLRLQEGMYSVFLKDWLKVFPRNQLFIYKFEDYVQDTPAVMDKIYQFLDLAPVPRKTDITGRKNGNKKKGKPLDGTVDILQKFYAPFNEALPALLGGDQWLWHYDNI